jgi:hypothetical protein
MKYIDIKIKGQLYPLAEPDIHKIHIRNRKKRPMVPAYNEDIYKSVSPAVTEAGESLSFG